MRAKTKKIKKEKKMKTLKTQKATFAAGCFWGVEETFRKMKGVVSTRVGYAGGLTESPTYRDVSTGSTGHAESVEVEFNPKEISYEKLLEIFWSIHNPTTLNRQGPDVGSQYRSIIFYYNDEQKKAAEKSLKEEQKKYKDKIVTEIKKAGKFNEAEAYHQEYLKKRGLFSCSI